MKDPFWRNLTITGILGCLSILISILYDPYLTFKLNGVYCGAASLHYLPEWAGLYYAGKTIKELSRMLSLKHKEVLLIGILLPAYSSALITTPRIYFYFPAFLTIMLIIFLSFPIIGWLKTP